MPIRIIVNMKICLFVSRFRLTVCQLHDGHVCICGVPFENQHLDEKHRHLINHEVCMSRARFAILMEQEAVVCCLLFNFGIKVPIKIIVNLKNMFVCFKG